MDSGPEQKIKPTRLPTSREQLVADAARRAERFTQERKTRANTQGKPHLPRGDYKIVIRPTGGIKLSEHGVVDLTAAVQDAAGIPVEEREEDITCPNNYQNILIGSTPDQEHANKYQAIARIKVQGKFYATNAYETAPDMTAKGVIRGIPLEEGPRDITAAVVTTKNPTAIAAKRLSNTTTAIVLFEGHKVPTFVRYRATLLRCSLYREQVISVANATDLDTGETYVPTLTTSFVPVVEPPNPDEGHQCEPKCQLCGADHSTADKTCKAKFKKPFIVKQR
ncbi:hypothetical protein MTO96_006252 [Rhipicephalus appendiculatus]